MSTPADKLASTFAKAEATLMRNLGADTYRIIRTETTRDEYGGTVEVETFPESGRCLLQRGGTKGVESISGSIVLARADFVAQLPRTSIVKATDVLEVNDERYTITGVKRTGNVGVFTTVELEKQG